MPEWEPFLEETLEDAEAGTYKLSIQTMVSEEPTGFKVRAQFMDLRADRQLCEVSFLAGITNPITVSGIVITAATIYGVCVGVNFFDALWVLARLSYDESVEAEPKARSIFQRIGDTTVRFVGKKGRMKDEGLKVLKDCVKKVKSSVLQRLPRGDDKKSLPPPGDDKDDGGGDY